MNPDRSEHLVKLRFRYRNYRGEESVRTVVPINLYVGATKHHPERQLLLQAFCCDKKQERTFAVKCILSRLECVNGGEEKDDPYAGCEWENCGHYWLFGRKVRGIVRDAVASITWMSWADSASKEPMWRWDVLHHLSNGRKMGAERNRDDAIRKVEEALGIGGSKEEKSCTP